MKHSIRGTIPDIQESLIIDVMNAYRLWKLDVLLLPNPGVVTFEVWVDSLPAKDEIFNSLKTLVDEHNGVIDYHQCYHDEPTSSPCSIQEIYGTGVQWR